MILAFSILLVSFVSIKGLSEGSFVIENTFGAEFSGILAGFGDFNADKLVDIFAISGQNVDVWLTDKTGGFSKRNLINLNSSHPSGDYIIGLVLTDFNGDGYLDILCSKKSAGHIRAEIYWGSKNGLDYNIPIASEIKDEPVLFEFNGDGLPDLLVEDVNNNSLTVWLSANNSFQEIKFPENVHLSSPHSSAFVNITPLENTDLVVTASNYTYMVFADNVYDKPYKVYQANEKASKTNKLGQSSFADFNQDGVIDHVVPVDNQIHVYFKNTWNVLGELSNDFQFDFLNNISYGNGIIYSIPPTLIIGDYDSDGYPDMLTIVIKNNRHVAILLRNVPCTSGDRCRSFGRELELQELPELKNDVHLAAFYDYMEDGSLDILLTTKKPTDAGTELETVLLKNTIAADTCFMKVTVSSGLLGKFTSDDGKPYGLNIPGPSVSYETVKTTGEYQKSCASQMTQSAHFSLQLPFILFGLGQTPNFVDSIQITLPREHNKKLRTRQWQQIIPNSQLIVNPNQLDYPQMWTMQLFVIPSKQIFTTAAVLGSTCIGLVFIVGGLLWKEHKEDQTEKKQGPNRFHFDAM